MHNHSDDIYMFLSFLFFDMDLLQALVCSFWEVGGEHVHVEVVDLFIKSFVLNIWSIFVQPHCNYFAV